MIIQRAVCILRHANSAPKPFHARSLRAPALLSQHPKTPTPSGSPLKSRFSMPGVCISGYANSPCNSFNARGLCAPAPLEQHRTLLHLPVCPLRFFLKDPKLKLLTTEMTPSRFTFHVHYQPMQMQIRHDPRPPSPSSTWPRSPPPLSPATPADTYVLPPLYVRYTSVVHASNKRK